MKRLIVYGITTVIAVLFVKLFIFSSGDSNEDHAKLFRENYHVYTVNIPKEISFADEKIPLDIFDVRERLDRELLVNVYWQSQTLLLIKRAHRWFPVIEPILKKNNVPDDFK